MICQRFLNYSNSYLSFNGYYDSRSYPERKIRDFFNKHYSNISDAIRNFDFSDFSKRSISYEFKNIVSICCDEKTVKKFLNRDDVSYKFPQKLKFFFFCKNIEIQTTETLDWINKKSDDQIDKIIKKISKILEMDRKDPEFRIINSELKIAKGDYLLLIMNNESKKLLEIQKTKERYKYLEEFDDEIDRYRKDLETADEEDRKIIEKIIENETKRHNNDVNSFSKKVREFEREIEEIIFTI